MLAFTSGKLRLLPQNEGEYSGALLKLQASLVYPGGTMANLVSEERIIELEAKIAYHEDWLESLSATVAAQQQQVDQLEKVCRPLIDGWEQVNDALKSRSSEEYECPP